MSEQLLQPKPLLDCESTSPQVRRLLEVAPLPTPLDDERRRAGRLALSGANSARGLRRGVWVLCGAVLCLGAVAAARTLWPTPAKSSLPAPRVSGRATPAANQLPPSVVVEGSPPPTAPPESATGAEKPPSKGSAKARDVSLEAELAALRAAREQLAANPSRALLLSRAHSSTFPGAKLQAEAKLLEVEALVRLGRRDEASRAGRQLLAFPGASLYRERLESLIGERTNP